MSVSECVFVSVNECVCACICESVSECVIVSVSDCVCVCLSVRTTAYHRHGEDLCPHTAPGRTSP